jgi:hypothetical protein
VSGGGPAGDLTGRLVASGRDTGVRDANPNLPPARDNARGLNADFHMAKRPHTL